MEEQQVNEENKQPEQEPKEIEQPPEEKNPKIVISQETEINEAKNTQDKSCVSKIIFNFYKINV